jgi:hypothetical protein
LKLGGKANRESRSGQRQSLAEVKALLAIVGKRIHELAAAEARRHGDQLVLSPEGDILGVRKLQ